MSCIADELVFDFVQGDLSEDERKSVDLHLDSCGECRSLVAGVMKTTHSAHEDEETELPWRAGARVGRYLLLEVVGSGASGVVYAGYDPDLDRKVAIKLLHAHGDAESADTQSLRLLREAQSMAKLSHPNVVAIHEVGTLHDSVFLVMDLVEGQTLREWLAGKPPLKEVVEVFTQTARGLACSA